MHHLLETAHALQPHVRGTPLSALVTPPSSDPPLVQLRAACENALFEQEVRRMQDKQAADDRVCVADLPPPATASRENQALGAESWGTTNEVRAVEILADVLARNAGRISIPQALRDAGLNFYPRYLSYLAETVVEAAQPAYQPHSVTDWLWWHLWTWFAAREYVAQLRDRYRNVAEVLIETRSWDECVKATSSTGPSEPGELRPGSDSDEGGTTVSMLGTGEVTQAGSNVRTKASETWKSMIDKFWGSTDDELQNCVDVLKTDGPKKRQFIASLKQELLDNLSLVRRLATVSGAAVPFDLAFDKELCEVSESRAVRVPNGPQVETGARYAPSAAADLKLFGVAFSGGGIRSATFNLGVLQGLAGARLLHKVDYLSTVSGGGYIGAWLATCIKRSRPDPDRRGVADLERRLQVEPLPRPDDEGVRAVRFLREYSNYLTPRAGFFSADTWTMAAIWVRNTLLNQCVLVMTLGSVLLVPWMIWAALIAAVPHQSSVSPSLFASAPVAMTTAAILLVLVSAMTGLQLKRYHLPPRDRQRTKDDMLDQTGVLVRIVAPVIAAVWLLSVVIYSALPRLSDGAFRLQARNELTVVFAVGLLLVALLGEYWRCFEAERVATTPTRTSRFWSRFGAAVIIFLGCAAPSFVGAAAVVSVAARVGSIEIPPGYPRLSLHWAVLGVPTIISVFSLMIILKLGIFGRSLRDDHREWWSRLGAWLAIVTFGWLVLFVFGVYSPFIFKYGTSRLQQFVVASGGLVWAAWTGAGVLIAKGEKAPGLDRALKRARVREAIVSLAPYVFIAGLLVLVATGACWALSGFHPANLTEDAAVQKHWLAGQIRHWLIAGPLLFLSLAFLMSSRVDVNDFSMHHFYKNRLVRCYLGASRDRRSDITHRCQDRFTGFDSADDLDIADLRVEPCRGDKDLEAQKIKQNDEKLRSYIGPLPIINAALNLVHGDDLAWQERKAQSFSFTPLYSGYERGENVDQATERCAPEGFRPTLLYGYPPFGIGLGTAVAISGAAASPNMGYHSSPPLAFLMTMFNARLGWWMGNPRDKYNWLRSGPRSGLLYLVNELLGLTDDRSHFVNLSDGGHFENLGLYELVRRRCRYIIACDAEQDDALKFNGLGNAIRKCRTDLGTEITIRATRIQPEAGNTHSTIHCVVGDITYPDNEVGTLLYLKASVTGDEPADVLEYRAREPAFPHHSTMADQFFDESQFESYRKLGVHVVKTAFGVPDSESVELDKRFSELRDYWYPASAAIEQHFSRHAQQYDALLERLREAPALEFIDAAFFDPAGTTRRERQELFVGASMLDLMQRVFLDLDLERDAAHPHNAGWMAIFRNWVRHDAVQSAWEASRHSYGRRFQRFVDGLRKV